MFTFPNKMSLTDDNVDEERLKYMKRIKLESGFFNTFRNTLRMLLGQYNHKTVRGNIEANVNNDKLTGKLILRYFTICM